MIPKKTDVVVIGGGPAGAMAAAMLAKQGIDVVLLEKERFPRYMVGESLIPHFWKFTDLIGASDAIEKAGFIQKSGGSVFWEEELKIMSFAPYGYKKPGLHVERDEFDYILLSRSKALGANVFEETQVDSVDTFEHESNVYYTAANEEKGVIQTRFLIDASGQSALLAKQFGFRKFDHNFRFQAFWAYFDQSEFLDQDGKINTFDQRFNVKPTSLISGTGDWGWSWNLLLKNKVSVGAIIPKNLVPTFKSKGRNLPERFKNYIQNIPLTAGVLEDSQLISDVKTIRDYAYLPTKLAFNNCYLIGDAAAFADPINSEGVTMGLYGGMMAAWAVENSLKNEKRQKFYQKVFVDSLDKRFSVFQLLSYPKDKIPPHLLDDCMNLIKNQSEVENNLILAHLNLTNRAQDFPNLLDAMNININRQWKEIPLEGPIVEKIGVIF